MGPHSAEDLDNAEGCQLFYVARGTQGVVLNDLALCASTSTLTKIHPKRGSFDCWPSISAMQVCRNIAVRRTTGLAPQCAANTQQLWNRKRVFSGRVTVLHALSRLQVQVGSAADLV